MRVRKVLKFAAVALIGIGVALIAYTGLTGTRGTWYMGSFQSSSAMTPGLTGYILGAVCIIGGIAILAAIERQT